ncbi:MAG: HD domain-containing protein [Eubacteriales bacterium]
MKTIPALPEEKIDESKKEFIGLLKSIDRPGMDDLVAWLENETDFFSAPASSRAHGVFEGGLLVHSLNVYKLLTSFAKNITGLNQQAMIVVGLLHDICKVNFYKKSIKNVKVPGEKRWEEEEGYTIDDLFPLGHGEKSVYLAMKYIRLTDEEAVSIRWHMGGYDDSARSYIGGLTQSAAYEKYPLAAATAIADMYAAHFTDKR